MAGRKCVLHAWHVWRNYKEYYTSIIVQVKKNKDKDIGCRYRCTVDSLQCLQQIKTVKRKFRGKWLFKKLVALVLVSMVTFYVPSFLSNRWYAKELLFICLLAVAPLYAFSSNNTSQLLKIHILTAVSRIQVSQTATNNRWMVRNLTRK